MNLQTLGAYPQTRSEVFMSKAWARNFDDELEVMDSFADADIFLSSRMEKRVLVIDDDLYQIPVLDDFIKELNPYAIVDWEYDAARAISRIEMAAERQDEPMYDLIVSDIVLEGELTGVDILQYCHRYTPKTRAILISGQNHALLKKKFGKLLNMIDFIEKPLKFSTFQKIARPVLEE